MTFAGNKKANKYRKNLEILVFNPFEINDYRAAKPRTAYLVQ